MLRRMFETEVKRIMAAYPTIYLACHRDHIRVDAAGKPITENQASVLDHLDTTRATTLSKLAEHMGVGRSTMSTTVSRLVEAGYIARHRDVQDKRSVNLTLTAVGKRLQEQNTVLNPQLVRQLLKLMPQKEAERALTGLECLAGYASVLLKRRKRAKDR